MYRHIFTALALLASLPLVFAVPNCRAEAPTPDVTANQPAIPAKLAGVWLSTNSTEGFVLEFSSGGIVKASNKDTPAIKSLVRAAGNTLKLTRRKGAETEVEFLKITKLTDRQLVLELVSGSVVEFDRK